MTYWCYETEPYIVLRRCERLARRNRIREILLDALTALFTLAILAAAWTIFD